MDEIRLESYSKVLTEEFSDDADTFLALEKLAMTPRGEFDPIIPPKVDLIRLVKNVRWSRNRAAREAAEAEAERIYAETVKAEREAGLLEHLDIEGAVKSALEGKTRKEETPRQAPDPTPPAPVVLTECQHCGPICPTSSVDLFRLARYYQQKAERALDRETAAPPETEAADLVKEVQAKAKVEGQ